MESYYSWGYAAITVILSYFLKNTFLSSFSKYYNRRGVTKAKKLMSGPISLPILGSFPHILLRIRNPFKLSSFELLDEIRKIWGSPISVTLGRNKMIVVDDIELIRKLMVSEDWAHRIPNDYIWKARTFDGEYGLLTSNGESWKEMRRYIQKTLIKFGFGRSSSLEMRHEEEILKLFIHLDDKIENMDFNFIQMQGLFNITALNILWEMVASTRYPYDSQEISELTCLLEKFAYNIHPRELGFLAFPWLRHIPGATGYVEVIQDCHKMQDYFKKIINSRRLEGTYKKEQNNFVDAFLAEIDYHKDNNIQPNYYTDEQLIMVLLDLFLTGFLPIGSCLEYLIMFMILNPKIQQKCYEEIDSVVGRNRYPSINDTESLPYVHATCIEVLRKVTFIPLTIRTAVKDTYLDDYLVPKDTQAVINLYAIHNNPKIFDKPDEFRPERFLDFNGKVANQDTILPFGTGKRVCPAEVFGRLSSFTFFTYLLQRYKFEVTEGDQLPDPMPNSGMGNYPKPYSAKITKR